MSTFLFDEMVFGPVQSRRLGVSLGINLLPVDCKYCNFDCIYCECGRNPTQRKSGGSSQIKKNILPARQEIYAALERKLLAMQQVKMRPATFQQPDAITFAGNGEPTMHPEFAGIIDDTVILRNRYTPQSKISVLTNATMLHRKEIVDALKKTDMPILKFDSAIDTTVKLLNQPVKLIPVLMLIQQLQSFGKQCIIQTMFMQGTYCGQTVDNTTSEELYAWEHAILAIRPRQVMIYTISRDTPTDSVRKVSGKKLREIAAIIERHGVPVLVSE